MAEKSNKTAKISFFPFMRSVENTERGAQEMHFPIIHNTAVDHSEKAYIYSTATAWTAIFVLYTHKNVPVDLNNLNALELVTDVAHVDLLDADLSPITNVKGAIQMVNAGRIDGFIFADVAVDPLIKSLNLTKIRRTHYRTFDVKALIAKGERTEMLDAMFSEAIDEMIATGEIKKTVPVRMRPFDPWQPYLTLPEP